MAPVELKTNVRNAAPRAAIARLGAAEERTFRRVARVKAGLSSKLATSRVTDGTGTVADVKLSRHVPRPSSTLPAFSSTKSSMPACLRLIVIRSA